MSPAAAHTMTALLARAARALLRDGDDAFWAGTHSALIAAAHGLTGVPQADLRRHARLIAQGAAEGAGGDTERALEALRVIEAQAWQQVAAGV